MKSLQSPELVRNGVPSFHTTEGGTPVHRLLRVEIGLCSALDRREYIGELHKV